MVAQGIRSEAPNQELARQLAGALDRCLRGTIGAGFVLLSRTLESSGQLFDLSPWIVGWGPTLRLAALTMALLTRIR